MYIYKEWPKIQFQRYNYIVKCFQILVQQPNTKDEVHVPPVANDLDTHTSRGSSRAPRSSDGGHRSGEPPSTPPYPKQTENVYPPRVPSEQKPYIEPPKPLSEPQTQPFKETQKPYTESSRQPIIESQKQLVEPPKQPYSEAQKPFLGVQSSRAYSQHSSADPSAYTPPAASHNTQSVPKSESTPAKPSRTRGPHRRTPRSRQTESKETNNNAGAPPYTHAPVSPPPPTSPLQPSPSQLNGFYPVSSQEFTPPSQSPSGITPSKARLTPPGHPAPPVPPKAGRGSSSKSDHAEDRRGE